MNCKPGDLAIVVKSAAGNEGKIVRCLELIPAFTFVRRDRTEYTCATWRIDRPLRGVFGSSTPHAPDQNLRPIRNPGDDAVDESLLWLPSPGKVTEAA